LGFKALATTSGGLAFSRGLPDNMTALSRDAVLAHIRDIVLTARCEAWLVGDPDAFRTAIHRLVAYADAGADCLFAPGVREPHEIEAIVKAVSPKPVNILMSSAVPGLSVERLADLGVRRISVGSALARSAWGAFLRAARSIAETGSFDCLADTASFSELNEIFKNCNT
jgi:2-methylisocitrate lyase-like PEP mutase family enzyme